MIERDDKIKVLGEIKIELESGTHKVIEKLSQEKVSQQEALEKFKWTIVRDHEIKVLGEVNVELESGRVAKEVIEIANDQAEALSSDKEVTDECLDDKHVGKSRPSKRIRVTKEEMDHRHGVVHLEKNRDLSLHRCHE
nr:hypothetical protein [Tanacetum cinerariifolium]